MVGQSEVACGANNKSRFENRIRAWRLFANKIDLENGCDYSRAHLGVRCILTIQAMESFQYQFRPACDTSRIPSRPQMGIAGYRLIKMSERYVHSSGEAALNAMSRLSLPVSE